tara:strand:- start:591 stop:1283 length:693 start_codon:yes stop_codon:yes gene_type:complete
MYSEVRLVGVTKPTEDMSLGEFIAYCARVSNPSNQNNHMTSPKLLNYLIKNNHWSPFEMASITMEIKTTRDIARQILRHRSFSFQEFSQRYAEQSNFYLREARLQDEKNRQNSIEIEDEKLQEDWKQIQRNLVEFANRSYQTALGMGIAKEQARAILPEGNTASTLYMSGTVRSWIHYCDLRCGNGTQKEHMDVANKCKIILDNLLQFKDNDSRDDVEKDISLFLNEYSN